VWPNRPASKAHSAKPTYPVQLRAFLHPLRSGALQLTLRCNSARNHIRVIVPSPVESFNFANMVSSVRHRTRASMTPYLLLLSVSGRRVVKFMVRSALEASKECTLPAWKSRAGQSREHAIFHAVLCAPIFFLLLVTVFIDDIDVRVDPVKLRLGIHPPAAGGDERLSDMANHADNILSLQRGKEGMVIPLQQTNVRVAADDHIQVAKFRRFFEKSDMS